MADAVRKLAADQGKKEGAVRTNYYNDVRKVSGSEGTRTRRTPGAALFAEDALSGARDLLQQALRSIDNELEVAKTELPAAQTRYDEVASSAATRRKELERKLKALSA